MLLNKRGAETCKFLLSETAFIDFLISHVEYKTFAEILIRLILLDSCYSSISTPLLLVNIR